jgi:hypothetical protein
VHGLRQQVIYAAYTAHAPSRGDRWRFTIQGPLHDGEAIIGFACAQGSLFLALFSWRSFLGCLQEVFAVIILKIPLPEPRSGGIIIEMQDLKPIRTPKGWHYYRKKTKTHPNPEGVALL